MTDSLFVRNAEAPREWVSALRAIDPIREAFSYLAFQWYAPAQRWVLYEMVPAHAVDPDVLMELRALERPPVKYGVLLDRLVSGLQWELYQQTGRFALPCWVLQGTKGGHLVSYDRMTQKMCQRAGLPVSPPAVGTLPPCPFDNRAIRQLVKLNRLHQVRDDIDAFVRSTSPDAITRKQRDEMRQFRREFLDWLDGQTEETAEHFQRAFRTGEADYLPVCDVDWTQQHEQAREQFIETGALA